MLIRSATSCERWRFKLKPGFWHQCGDRSQTIALEQLKLGNGVGVILSPRDLTYANAKLRGKQYEAHGASVLVDPQFYLPTSSLGPKDGWDLSPFHLPAAKLAKLSPTAVSALSRHLAAISKACSCSGIIAPAVILEAGHPEVVDANRVLFAAAKTAGDSIGVPTYCCIPVGHSVVQSSAEIANALAAATSNTSSGWLLAWEFGAGRLPASTSAVQAFGSACVALATSGKPVLHLCAGPLAILSPAFGCKAAGVCHSQNTWKLDRSRFIKKKKGGGGGDAPPRYFSSGLWGTLVFPDEYAALTPSQRAAVHTPTPFSLGVRATPPFNRAQLPKWDTNKHLLFAIGNRVKKLTALGSARAAAVAAKKDLDSAAGLHASIAASGKVLKDETAAYQQAWSKSIELVLAAHKNDYDFLDLL